MSNIEDKVQELQTQHAAFKADFQTKSKKVLQELIDEVFQEVPQVNSITWQQYTPYFNDGEECIFSVHEPTISNAIEEDDVYEVRYGEYQGETEGIYATDIYSGRADMKEVPDMTAEQHKLLLKFSNFIQNGSFKEIFKDVFGDHVEVFVVRGKEIEVEFFDHD